MVPAKSPYETDNICLYNHPNPSSGSQDIPSHVLKLSKSTLISMFQKPQLLPLHVQTAVNQGLHGMTRNVQEPLRYYKVLSNINQSCEHPIIHTTAQWDCEMVQDTNRWYKQLQEIRHLPCPNCVIYSSTLLHCSCLAT